jgi:hypothetical protein
MATLKKLINDYGKVLDFNQKVAYFLEENRKLLSTLKTDYSQKTLLAALNDSMTVSFGLKSNGQFGFVEKNSSNKHVASRIEIHCLTTDTEIDSLTLGFEIHLIIKIDDTFIMFPIAKSDDFCFSPISKILLNRKKKTIVEARKNQSQRLAGDHFQNFLIFESRKDFDKVADVCKKAINEFNDQLPEEEKLTPNINL